MSHYSTLKGLGRAVAYYPEIAIKLGSSDACILLCQLIYWSDKTDNSLGVYKTSEEWTAETGLSYSKQRTARKLLCSLGILVETNKRLEHKIFFKLDTVKFDQWFQKCLENSGQNSMENTENGEIQNVISRNEDLAFGNEQNVNSGASNSNSVIHKITSQDYIHKTTGKKINKKSPMQKPVSEKPNAVKKTKNTMTELPENFAVSERVLEWANKNNFNRLDEHLENFIGYVKANAKRYADWDQALMNAIRGNWARLQGHANPKPQNQNQPYQRRFGGNSQQSQGMRDVTGEQA
ncbi:hypothetical protein I2F17_09220 [Acinetobacter sp. B10A]|uniref:hypothetical protein n=1 Tax=Acinetobacter baretiae TaxID=2605383 RepID=UPI001B3C9F8F|nr:hypothetical protein [Acinetobacter baretiae]MBF7685996.1 hypothetical protein [Acinetobacter baretiae]